MCGKELGEEPGQNKLMGPREDRVQKQKVASGIKGR